MKTLAHHVMSLIAVALIALSGAASLAGSHHMQAGVEMVICADGALQTVTIGADGQPIQPQSGKCPHCPSCLPTPVATLANAVSVQAFAKRWTMALVVVPGAKIAPLHWMAPIARGPPLHSLDECSLTYFAALLPRGSVHRAQPMERLA